MKKKIALPKLSDEMKSAVLCAWLKQEGEEYKKGEPIYEIETEKVISQVEAEEDGIMVHQLVEEGDEVSVGAELAEVE